MLGARFGLWPGELDIATSDWVLGDTHRQSQGRSPDAVMCPLLWHPRGRDQVVATVPLDLANLFLPPSSHRRLADELYSYTFITLQLTLSWDRSFPGRGMLGILPGFRLWVQFLEVTEAGNCWSAALARRAAVSGGVGDLECLPPLSAFRYMFLLPPCYAGFLYRIIMRGKRWDSVNFFFLVPFHLDWR